MYLRVIDRDTILLKIEASIHSGYLKLYSKNNELIMIAHVPLVMCAAYLWLDRE